METDTFPRDDVRTFLAGMICLKVDASRDPGVAEKFNVRGVPTFVLLHPNGDTLFNESGKPPGNQFISMFTHAAHNAMVKAYNAKDYAKTAKHVLFLRQWFPKTKSGKEAEEIYAYLEKNERFLAEYRRLESASLREIETIRERARKERARRERIERCRLLKEEADRIYATKGKRFHSYKLYKHIILEYPDLPDADDARKRLRKHGVRFKDPAKEDKKDKKKKDKQKN